MSDHTLSVEMQDRLLERPLSETSASGVKVSVDDAEEISN